MILSKILLVACIASGMAALYFAGYPELYKRTKSITAINNYTVKGFEKLDSVEIANCIKIDDNSNFFNVSTDSIVSRIERIQGVEKVKVSKMLFSNSLDIKITQRVPNFLVNVNNELHLMDKNGALWKSNRFDKKDDFCLVTGLKPIQEKTGKMIHKNDLDRLEKTYCGIRGKGANSNNIKSIQFKENDIVEFAASNISVPIRLNSTLKYSTDDLVKLENILRNGGKTPIQYIDVYDNVIFVK
jgi:cell division septal protein FtsQ